MNVARLCLAAALCAAVVPVTLPAQQRVMREMAPAADPAVLRKEIEDLHQKMVAALKANPASVAAFYTDDARVVGGGQTVTGRERIDAYWAGISGAKDWVLEILDVGGTMGQPWLLGRSTLTMQSGGQSIVNYLGVLRRMPDGSLKYQVDFYTAAPRSR